ncbi:SDR family NAD(P)-dependent oxidoreductase [Paenibacillus macquariensis]|uniref:NAD(P)-dependent dehydrogenase, short-chain alcohol dehydrogenase family n=1 Tax=Paenibacillus macquariensis TaxID=948756 RepID=A0ABY1JM30_9BACL|nr:SDR family NAD(P)-dependent oxidoreductase [Paenibacillus macquariensis]MEC0090598.1 SDR family NAD(P)-dependent oxidoreductase [Paenibacillus macquariensis]OAB25019.1 short-chain dehydrogenase [Paenibacillus macquariensis subsp. macquariensis]SIQ44579.1 NAD(P)-dependent dehydrogenase, short-chain alcohol dehydrogenase family [Paenibacillus macquariensis]
MENVLITGANRGLGLELQKVFYSSSFNTFPVVRTEAAAEQLRVQFPLRCYPIVADLTSDDSIERIRMILDNTAHSLDIVINNAGISGTEYLIETVRTEEVNNLFNIHCLGAIRTVQASIPHLRKSNNPRIINVSSRLGSLTRMATGEFKDRGFSYSYRMAKAAQNMFTICLGQELKKDNITVCAIHPGQLLTRGRSTDANTDPASAAENIYKWIREIDINSSGVFVQPLVQNMSW